jgi:hypothetical protein
VDSTSHACGQEALLPDSKACPKKGHGAALPLPAFIKEILHLEETKHQTYSEKQPGINEELREWIEVALDRLSIL